MTVTVIYVRCSYCTRHLSPRVMDGSACADCLESGGVAWPIDDEES